MNLMEFKDCILNAIDDQMAVSSEILIVYDGYEIIKFKMKDGSSFKMTLEKVD